MSRFPELFEEAIDEVVMGEAMLVERSPSTSRATYVERSGRSARR